MTERSYFQNGVTKGDAVVAPYSDTLFASILRSLQINKDSYIIPLYGNNMRVTAGAGKTVDVASGAAFVNGTWFESTATENITIPDNNELNPRIDRVVIRINYYNNTGEIVLKTGRANETPEKPTLNQTENVHEVSLAYIYVPASFAAASNNYIYDERRFINTATHYNLYALENKMFNSEFIAMADSGADVNTPAMWEQSGHILSMIPARKFDAMARGTTLYTTLASGDTLYTHIKLTNNPTANVPVTIRMLVQVEDGELQISTGGALSGTTKYINATDGPIDLIIRDEINNANSFINLAFTISPTATTAPDFYLGQITITYGYVACEYGPQTETILLGSDTYDYSVTNRSTSTIPVAYEDIAGNTAYGLQYMGSMLWLLEANDNGSSGTNTANCKIQDTGNAISYIGIEVGRLPNSSIRWACGWLPILTTREDWDTIKANDIFDIVITASGANAFDVDLYLIGINI